MIQSSNCGYGAIGFVLCLCHQKNYSTNFNSLMNINNYDKEVGDRRTKIKTQNSLKNLFSFTHLHTNVLEVCILRLMLYIIRMKYRDDRNKKKVYYLNTADRAPEERWYAYESFFVLSCS